MIKYAISSAFLIIGAFLIIVLTRNGVNDVATLTVLCGPSLSGPMEEAKAEFMLAGDGGVGVEITYRGSGELLSLYQISQIGDVLVAADVFYHESFVAKGFCDQPVTLGRQYPCLIFTSVSEETALSTLGVHEPTLVSSSASTSPPATSLPATSLPKMEHAAIGRRVAEILGSDRYQSLTASATVTRETVSQVAADVSNSIVDVGVAWSTTPKQFRNLRSVVPPGWETGSSKIGASVFAGGQNQDVANRFRSFLASAQGRAIFERHGFAPPLGNQELNLGGTR